MEPAGKGGGLNLRVRALIALVVVIAVAFWTPAPLRPAASLLAGCLALWLLELVPPFVPTILLLAGSPLVLPDRGTDQALRIVLGWAADPVLALFLGGLALGVAAQEHRLDEILARRLLHASGGHVRRLAILLMLGTAMLSMWMSNIAAAALMMAAAGPALLALEKWPLARRSLVVAIAMGANFGGIATPIGTGPNGIAIAALAERGVRVTFAAWMAFAVPLTLLLLLGAYALLHRRLGGAPPIATSEAALTMTPRGKAVLGVALVAIAAWLSEPLHGVPAAVISLALAAALFGSGLLARADFLKLDWSTLTLVAGGITMGRLIEELHLVEPLVARLAASGAGLLTVHVLLCAAAALLSAVMSNTATAALLLPLAAQLDPAPSTLVLVAVATSVGAPFLVSTPPNAMAAERGATATDLLRPGGVVLVVGVLLIALTGPTVLRLFGLGG